LIRDNRILSVIISLKNLTYQNVLNLYKRKLLIDRERLC